jgi:methylmalonyl-CoA carboxyltransferase 12S subunit
MSEPVPEPENLSATLLDIQKQLADLSSRLAAVEKLAATSGAPAASTGNAETRPSEPIPAASSVSVAAGVSEEEFLAISAALAAWLGVQAHIRQIRLIHTGAWAQQGRATIQASHRLHY